MSGSKKTQDRLGRGTKPAARVREPEKRVVRELNYQTTRNDSGQRVVNREKEAEKGSFMQILGSFKPFRAGGRGIWEAWGAGGAESFLRKWG